MLGLKLNQVSKRGHRPSSDHSSTKMCPDNDNAIARTHTYLSKTIEMATNMATTVSAKATPTIMPVLCVLLSTAATTRGFFELYCLAVIGVSISNHVHGILLNAITYPFSDSMQRWFN